MSRPCRSTEVLLLICKVLFTKPLDYTQSCLYTSYLSGTKVTVVCVCASVFVSEREITRSQHLCVSDSIQSYHPMQDRLSTLHQSCDKQFNPEKGYVCRK